jgi:hypothetical protein
MSRFWFARQFPLTEPQNTRMSPVSAAGWAVVSLFAGCLIAGLAGLVLFSFVYRAPFVGFVTFAGFALAGLALFVLAVKLKGDTQHTVAEHRGGRVGRG